MDGNIVNFFSQFKEKLSVIEQFFYILPRTAALQSKLGIETPKHALLPGFFKIFIC
jgi:hypothetical protein